MIDEAEVTVVTPPPMLPGPAERLLAQRAFFAAPFHQVPDDLYSVVETGAAMRERHRAVVQPHARLTTNTYFGRFPATYWQRWTAVTEVQLDVVVSGSGRLSVVASDINGETRTVASGVLTQPGEQVIRLSAKLDRFVDGGALWLDCQAGPVPLTVEHVRWSVIAPDRTRPTAVVICTFNQTDDCIHTLATLAQDADSLELVDAVYVVDQGTEIVEDHERFGEVERCLGAKLRYRRQPNLGGAGGFTRGLYEVTEVQHAEHANVLFMDDDILLEPDTVVRLTAFANRAVEPVIVGAQMLYQLHPNLVYGWAQAADLTTLEAGRPVPDDVHRVDVTEEQQELRVDADYNAWWTCLIPSEVVAAVGYPLPMFFQWDDVEYGYRARAAGHATVTLPGAGVWHADFDWKDEDSWANYFGHRNSLIWSALHGECDPKGNARVLRQRLLRYLVSMRYGLAAGVIKAVEDYLDGPETLRDGGVEAAAAVQKLRAEYPETYCHPACEVPGLGATATPLAPAPPSPSMERAVMVKRLLWQLLGRPRGTAAITWRDAYWWHVSRFRTAVVTDASQHGVRLRRLDRARLVALGRRGARVLRRLRREGPAVRQRYRGAMPELTSRENWTRLFESCLPQPELDRTTAGGQDELG